MASGDERRGKEPAAAAEEEEDKFPEGLRVLAVDDDPVCRRVLEASLRHCKYNPTMVTDAKTALEMLRGGEEEFDLVISDVHMPDMDGFKLLQIIGLDMDLPVIMLSVSGEKDYVYKGIANGACDYMVKPVNIKELRNIWQHVVRKNQGAVNHNSSDSDDADQRVEQPVIAEREQGGAKSKKCSKKKKKSDGDDSDENKESTSVRTTRKKPRVSWTHELHGRFLDVVNRLGVDRAVPKKILQMMNVRNLSRESVASHLQKYRLYLKRVTNDPKTSNHLGDSSQRRNSSSYMDMNHHEQPSSSVPFGGGSTNFYTAPSILGRHGLSIQPRNWTMGTAGNGGNMPRNAVPWLPDTTRHHASGPPVSSFANHTMLDAFPPSHSSNAYSSVLREKLLEASTVVPSSHPGNSSLAEMPNGGLSQPVNQFPVQPPELIRQFSSPMHAAPSAVYHVGSSSNPWQNVASSSFAGPMDGTPLLPSQVNMPWMNQLPSFGASPGQMPMFQNEEQNQMAGIINNNNTAVVGFSEQMTPLFNIASSTAPVEMDNDNFSPMTQMMVNGGSTSSPLPNLETGSPVAPPTQMVNGGSISYALPDLQDSSLAQTQVHNGGDASGILHVQEGPADQQALDDQPTYSNPFLEQIFTSMVNQDFNPDDAFFGGEY